MLIFIHIEKCGGTTIETILRRSFGARHINLIPLDQSAMCASNDDMKFLNKNFPKVCSISGHALRPWIIDKKNTENLMYTLLRDPISRYVSDFLHFGAAFNSVSNFSDWLRLSERHNFMTRSICGAEDVKAAKRVICEDFDLVGILEEFDEFQLMLQSLARPFKIFNTYEVQNAAGNRYKGLRKIYHNMYLKNPNNSLEEKKINYEKSDFIKYHDEIVKVNRLDIELYQYVKEIIIPAQKKEINQRLDINTTKAGMIIPKLNEGIHFLHRNMIYKKLVGVKPFRPHCLPKYTNALYS